MNFTDMISWSGKIGLRTNGLVGQWAHWLERRMNGSDWRRCRVVGVNQTRRDNHQQPIKIKNKRNKCPQRRHCSHRRFHVFIIFNGRRIISSWRQYERPECGSIDPATRNHIAGSHKNVTGFFFFTFYFILSFYWYFFCIELNFFTSDFILYNFYNENWFFLILFYLTFKKS